MDKQLYGDGKILLLKDLPKYNVVEHGKTDDGKVYMLGNVVSEEGDPCGEPLVIINGLAYILTWDDILEIAQRAGLFGGCKYMQISQNIENKGDNV